MSEDNPSIPVGAAGTPEAAVKDSSMPRGVPYIVGNEAAERFSFYGMTGILVGYMTSQVLKGGLGLDEDRGTEIMHLFVSASYFMPLMGAWLADKLIGRYHTILWVSLFYCAGHGVLACSDLVHGIDGKLACLYTGLSLIAFGAGGIKPCVSAFMGDQFKPNQAHLLQKAYGAFYWAINFGSFFSFLVIPWIAKHRGYGWAFGVPGLLMGLATLIFWLGTKHYNRVPPTRRTKSAGFFKVFWHSYCASRGSRFHPSINILATLLLPAVSMALMIYLFFASGATTFSKCAGWAVVICVGAWYFMVLLLSILGKTQLPDSFWQKASGRFTDREIAAARSFGPILFVLAFAPIFWSLFNQTNSTWVLQGSKMVPAKIFSFEIGAEEMQAVNAGIVMLLVPLLTLVVYPRLGRFATPLRRMSYGMFFASAAYVVVAALQQKVSASDQISVLWQTVPYFVLTVGEVLFSTTGLEFAFRESAPEMKSTIMSFWLLTVSFGNLIVTAITKTFSKAGSGGHGDAVTSTRFLTYAGLTFVVAILFSIVSSAYTYRDKEAAQGR